MKSCSGSGGRLARQRLRRWGHAKVSWLAAILALALCAVAASDGDAEAKPYSAYGDPKKTALSFVLSDEGNVRDFREEFGLTGRETEKALAAVRRENGRLAREYAESEELVEGSRGISRDGVRRRISASDYDAAVKAAIADTKDVVETLIPADKRPDLGPWVDERWRAERRESEAETARSARATARGITCSVYASYYYPNRSGAYEVALPHQGLKSNGGFKVRISTGVGTRAWAPVLEVGPWNTRDNYWQKARYRDMWDNLPQCAAQAQQAYYRNYNGGRDQFGRQVLNPAAIDLTLPVAERLGVRSLIQRRGIIRVNVFFPWVRR